MRERYRIGSWVMYLAPLLVLAGMFGGGLLGTALGEVGAPPYPTEAATIRNTLIGETLGVWLATAIANAGVRAMGGATRHLLLEHLWQALLLYGLGAYGAFVFYTTGAAIHGHLSGIGFAMTCYAAAAALANLMLLAWLRYRDRRAARGVFRQAPV